MQPPHEMCTGEDCLFKNVCYRFKATPVKDQLYFKDPPMNVTWIPQGLLAGRQFDCSEFWVLNTDRKAYVALSNRFKKEDQARLKAAKDMS